MAGYSRAPSRRTPAVHGGEKSRIAVVADAGRLVGRDVGGIERAEGQHEGESAGVRLAALGGVADHAIRGARQILAALRPGPRLRSAAGTPVGSAA